MAMSAERLARSLGADQLVSESWLIETVTGVHSRSADATASLVGSAVIEDLAALAIRLTDRAPIAAGDAEGGAFTLEEAAKQLGVGVRSVQRWRKLGLTSVRIQFGRNRRVGCTGAAIAWFRSHHPEALARIRRPASSQHARQRLLAQAELAAQRGGTLNAAATRLARSEGISVDVARRAIEQLERQKKIEPLRRRVALSEARAALAWRGWMRGVDLRTIAKRTGQSHAAALRSIAKMRRKGIEACRIPVAPLATFGRADAAETLLAPRGVREQLAQGSWPAHPREFLAAYPPLLKGPRQAAALDRVQLAALRFLLWQASKELGKAGAAGEWSALDRSETALRWAARLRLSLLQRTVGEALGRLQAMAWVAFDALPEARRRQAIEIAIDASSAVLDEAMSAPPSDRAIRLGSLAAALAEQRAAQEWKPRELPALGERTLLSDALQLRCVPWLRVSPLRDDLAPWAVAGDPGCVLLGLRYGWEGRAPLALDEAASLLRIHPRRAAMIAASALRELNQKLTRPARD